MYMGYVYLDKNTNSPLYFPRGRRPACLKVANNNDNRNNNRNTPLPLA